MDEPQSEPTTTTTASAGLDALQAQCAQWLVSAVEIGREMRLRVRPEGLRTVALYLRDDGEQRFDYAADMLALDTGAAMHVIYRVHAMDTGRSALIEVHIDRTEPALATVSDIWPGFNWFERECYDMYGIEFDGHPNQGDPTRMRILLPKDWEGFPFRKDYVPEFTDNPLFGPQRTN